MSRYAFPTPLLARIALDVARGRQRSLGADSAGGLRGASPPPLTLGAHHLPPSGPFVVVGNHYQRPGLWAGWGAMLVNAAVHDTGAAIAPLPRETRRDLVPRSRQPRRRELHWLMTEEMLDIRVGPIPIPREWVRAVFARFARVYGFGLVSPRETGVVGGASALRVAARYLAAGEPVGVLPEGTASEALCEARPGVGAFLAWLTRDGVPLVPVAIAEPDGVLTARFGPPFHLPRAPGGKLDRDRALREAVMVRIARLLPPELWGYYRDAATRGSSTPDRDNLAEANRHAGTRRPLEPEDD